MKKKDRIEKSEETKESEIFKKKMTQKKKVKNQNGKINLAHFVVDDDVDDDVV
jgi:hypothetical protein